ncbi:hypothetical protein EW146_g7395 [Bondarzewia mesenterica]|uniref:Fatty acid desaturase domain-containing protein n=1 Tax=Bondarzewia mesenterica TaxID=1095465 RepID=A0A4S4LKW4_9AGAM|nr:hypothetical protein EW146_g7395 [Bondarzewia mesenterica]
MLIQSWLGSQMLVRLYIVPWVLMSHWVIMIVYLQHSDPVLPHHRTKHWSYMRGALATMDRDFLGWQGRFFLHNIAHCHLIHHCFPKMPFYRVVPDNTPDATEQIKAILGPDYNYCDTPVFKVLWNNFKCCFYVDEAGDILFYKDKEGSFRRYPNMAEGQPRRIQYMLGTSKIPGSVPDLAAAVFSRHTRSNTECFPYSPTEANRILIERARIMYKAIPALPLKLRRQASSSLVALKCTHRYSDNKLDPLKFASKRMGQPTSCCTNFIRTKSSMWTQLPVVVTGASGFIGSHIVLELLGSGYRVRLLARGEKATILRSTIAKDNAKAEVVEIKDIATDDLTTAFQGAGAVIHVASPTAGRADPESALTSALEGTMNVLKQAMEHKVNKVVLTATWAATITPGDRTKVWSGGKFTENDWGRVTREQILDGTHDSLWVYVATKIMAEQAAWRFAEEHRELDLASINPPFVYGPFVKGLAVPGKTGLGSNGLLYQLIAGEKGRPLPVQLSPYFCDVRDVATAHVLALSVPPAQDVQSKRFLISGGHILWKDAVQFLANERPDLADRLPSLENTPPLPGPLSSIDTSRAKAVLGLAQYIGWEETVTDSFYDLLSAETTLPGHARQRYTAKIVATYPRAARITGAGPLEELRHKRHGFVRAGGEFLEDIFVAPAHQAGEDMFASGVQIGDGSNPGPSGPPSPFPSSFAAIDGNCASFHGTTRMCSTAPSSNSASSSATFCCLRTRLVGLSILWQVMIISHAAEAARQTRSQLVRTEKVEDMAVASGWAVPSDFPIRLSGTYPSSANKHALTVWLAQLIISPPLSLTMGSFFLDEHQFGSQTKFQGCSGVDLPTFAPLSGAFPSVQLSQSKSALPRKNIRSMEEIRNAVPSHLFVRHTCKGLGFLARDILFACVLFHFAFYFGHRLNTLEMSTPFGFGAVFFARILLWCTYGCSRDSYSQDYGLLVMNAATVPSPFIDGFAIHLDTWKISHHRHHMNHASMEHDEPYIPKTRSDLKIPAENAHDINYEEYFGDTPIYTVFMLVRQQLLAFPVYLPNCILFTREQRSAVLVSNLGMLVMGYVLRWACSTWGTFNVVKYYAIPWLFVNHWFVMITYLQHTDSTLPHYRNESFWAPSVGSFFPDVAHFHVVHHFFPKMPFYHGAEATRHLQMFIGKYHHHHSDESVFKALWNTYNSCQFVEDEGDIVFYRDKQGRASFLAQCSPSYGSCEVTDSGRARVLGTIRKPISSLNSDKFEERKCTNAEKKNIVVLGGSYVGCKAVELIAQRMHKTHRTVLVEQNTHFQHLFAFPRYAVVPGYEQQAFIPYTNMFSSSPPDSTSVVNARATEIHQDGVALDHGERIPYEFLVMATGTRLTPPGTLQSKSKLEGMKYLQEHQKHVEKARRIVIVGGGAVGVQMATDIKEYHPDKTVFLIHSRPHLMNKFHPKLHEIVMERAKELGIEVVLNERVKIPASGFPLDGSEFEVELNSGGKLPADFAIVATGQTPLSDPLRTLSPTSIIPSGFISVKRTFQLTDEAYPHVFAIGDIADTTHHKAARPGHVHADIVAQNIQKLAQGSSEPLDTYADQESGIHLSLGLAHNVRFMNPSMPEGEPFCQLSDDGSVDMQSERLWKAKAPGIIDYSL